MSDLIRRQDALDLFVENDLIPTEIVRACIEDLPAVQPHVNKTPKSEHESADMLTLTAERDRLREALRDGRRLLAIAQDDRVQLIAERDRFRKVLERVASLMHDEYNPYSIEGMLGDAARAALKGETP